MGMGKDGYYSMRDILGYNATFNIVLSDRGRGKTYGTVNFLMEQEGRFMCLYRQEPDMRLALRSWLDPFFEKHPEALRDDYVMEGSKEGWTLSVKGVVKGYFHFLTQVNHIKQMKFPDDLNWIWWDEFIPMAYKKLPGVDSEGDALRVIVKTIDHDTAHSRESKGLRPLRVLMYANPFTWNNPILSYFHINGLLGPGIHRAGPGIVWEMLEPYEESKKAKKMTTDEFLGNEVNRTMGFMKQNAFIEKFPKGLVAEYSIRLGTHYYLILRGGSQRGMGKYYIKKQTEHANLPDHCWGTLDGLMESERCIEDSYFSELLQRIVYNGKAVFIDINCKFDYINDISQL